MIGFDTNVILRLVLGDDPKQQSAATSYLLRHCTSEDPAWINRIVLAELVWVLEGKNEYTRTHIADLIERLLHTAEIRFEDHEVVRMALDVYRSGAEFADALIACGNALRCATTITFDKVAAKKLVGFTLLAPA